MKEQELKELMVAIRRNAKPSKCIDNYENLILEINDQRIAGVFVSEMSGFLSKLFELFHEVDKLDNLELKAKILTKEFIRPDSYFKKSKWIANRLMKMRAALEYQETPKHTISPHTKDADRKPIKIRYKEACDLGTEATLWYNGVNGSLEVGWSEDFKELARRTMLLYHYIPAVYKALLQTKRRGLKLDCNSRRY